MREGLRSGPGSLSAAGATGTHSAASVPLNSTQGRWSISTPFSILAFSLGLVIELFSSRVRPWSFWLQLRCLITSVSMCQRAFRFR